MYNLKEVYSFSKDLNILYVEDDTNLLKENSNIFKIFFKTVVTAVDGEDGLAKYISYKKEENNYYDLVITDINMPKKDGMEMIKDIKSLNKKQPIIVISAYSDSNKLIDLIQLGVESFILKPIKMEQLMNIFYKVSENIYTLGQKEIYLLEQSKNAAMGKMIDSIAHQWVQPINLLKMRTEMLDMENSDDELGKDDISEYVKKQSLQIEHIIDTLNEFRGFFRPDSEFIAMSYIELVDSSLVLLKDRLLKHRVEVEVNIVDSEKVKVISNEFKHVIINIVNNAIEEFKKNSIKIPKLVFNTKIDGEAVILSIADNAGGIPDKIIDDIFNINFTTKELLGGSGMGLYLSRMIVNKLGGELSVSNVSNGAKFNIALKKSNKG